MLNKKYINDKIKKVKKRLENIINFFKLADLEVKEINEILVENLKNDVVDEENLFSDSER